MTTPAHGMTYVDALIIVDVQNDFALPNGKLAVPLGESILPTLIRYIEAAFDAHIPVYASRDWHLANDSHTHNVHFETWLPHCLKDDLNRGADFHKKILKYIDDMYIITKGDNYDDDGYSAFEGRMDVTIGKGRRDRGSGPDNVTTLGQDLKRRGISRVFVGGLATDYCVKETVLDALKPDRPRLRRGVNHPLTPDQAAHWPGVAAVWLSDASLPVDVQLGDGDNAAREMDALGAGTIAFQEFSPFIGTETEPTYRARAKAKAHR